jgi:hypothetical protein
MIKMTNMIMFTAVLGLAAALLANCRGIEYETKNKDRAEIIIRSLYLHKEAHNSFPNELSDLVPDYLDKIPTTTGGQDYFYLANSTDGFLIFFSINSHYGCGYTDKLKEWECSSGD